MRGRDRRGNKNQWGASIPVFVTRATASGETGSLSISIWMAVLVLLLVWLNAVIWPVIGLIKAAEVLF
jgi:hypothetical protein